MKIAVLADSSCSAEIKNKFENLFMVPLMITDDNSNQIKDDESLTEDIFYDMLDNQNLKTSLTPPGLMLEVWDKILEDYDQIIVILLSKGLSSQYNAASLFSQEEKYANKVLVVDTNGVSIINDHFIEEAFKLIKQGKNGQEIKNELENLNDKFTVYIIPKSLKQLVKGGRITRAAANMAKLLKIVPVLKFDGTIDKETKTRTFRKAIACAIDLLQKKCPEQKIIDVTYSKSEKEDIKICHDEINKAKMIINYEYKLSNVITTHTGRGTFALACWNK